MSNHAKRERDGLPSTRDQHLRFRTPSWVVPTVQSVHILAIAIVMSSIAMLDLRLAGFIGRDAIDAGAHQARFYPWIWGALVVLLTDRRSS